MKRMGKLLKCFKDLVVAERPRGSPVEHVQKINLVLCSSCFGYSGVPSGKSQNHYVQIYIQSVNS